jgi:hypothetical protein
VKDYARQVGNKAKLMLNMRGEGLAPIAGETAGAVVSSQPARHTVVITQKDWPGSQTKLEQEAADGYRLTGVTISGMSTADASFLRTDATGGSVPVQAAAHDTFLELAEGHHRAGRGGFSGFARDARCPSG